MSALRTFKAFTNVAPVSPSIPIDSVGTNTKQLLFPCGLVNVDGVAGGAGYLQFFDSLVAPTTGVTVPLKSLKVDNGSGSVQPIPSFWPSVGPVEFRKGMYFAFSSTEAVYTADATNYDVWGEVIEFEGFIQPDGLTVVGDLTTDVDHLQVWTEGLGPNKLVELIVTRGTVGLTGLAYLMLFAKDSPVNLTEIPLAQWGPFSNTAALGDLLLGIKFGRDGLDVESQDDDYTRRKGCTFWLSDTTGFLTKASTGSTNALALKAYYK